MVSCFRNCCPKKNVSIDDKEARFCYLDDYNRTYDVPRFIFRTLGIRLTYYDSEFATLCWNIFFWAELGSICIAAILEMIYMLFVAQLATFEAAVQIVTMMPCLGYVLLALAKCYKLVYYRPVFESLVDELRMYWPCGPVTEEEFIIATNSLVQLNFIIKGYYWCNNIMTALYMAQPCLAWLKLMTGQDLPRVLPFFYWFPFDPYQPYLHEFLMVIQIWQGYVAVMYLLCGDMMFCILLSHIATQFDLLSCRIRRLIYVPVDDQLPETYSLEFCYSNDCDGTDTYEDVAWETKHHNDLVEIINRHRDLIRLAGVVENLYSFSLLLNFINSSIVICFCGFCCVIVEKVTEVVYKIFLVTALVQTWLLCWYGQRLLDSSKGITGALYNSGWYRASKKIRSSMFIMIHRSQKAVNVTTYGFSVVCLASFTTIVKTAWSYFTLLLNIYKQ